MKRSFQSLLWTLSLTVLTGCGPGNIRTNGNSVGTPAEKGKVIPSITTQKYYNVSYALYLPKSYTTSRKFPVIIAFDPQGSGTLPLEKYMDLADRYGYILMGSNDSKNGQDMNTAGVIIDALFSETSGRYSIDSTRIYVMGFSGGARIASMIGLYQGGVAGVIGCGAGFPSIQQPARFKPDYISFAGNADFNMNELIALDAQLDKAGFTHATVLFNGKHAWPPSEVMENAFIWTEFCSMRKGFIQKNDSMINRYIQVQGKKIEKDKSSADELARHDHLINLLRFVDGLAAAGEIKKEIAEVENSPVYLSQQKQLQQQMDKEMREQQNLNDNFFVKDTDWWKRKIGNYDSRIASGKDSADVRMCQRLKSYLSLISYMNYVRSVSTKDSVAAHRAMLIYEAVDPENAASTKAGKVK
jgi:dienelactone hydrolase